MQKVRQKLLAVMVMLAMILSCLPPKTALGAAYNAETDYETLDIRFWEDQKPPVGFYLNAAARYILETVPNPTVGSTFGEWSVMDLLRGQYTGYDYINYIPANYYSDYIRNVEQYVAANNGILDLNKSTEWSRITLAMSALGYDVRDVAGYDFIEKLSSSHRFSYRQGINGPIWEIIALNTAGYELYPDPTNADVNTIGKMIDYILKLEITQTDGTVGGWALTGKVPDADITGMALQAFAPYYLDSALYSQTGATASYEQFVQAVERGIVALANMQYENGGFGSWGTVNSESTVQVIVALTAMGFDPLSTSIALPNIGQTVSFVTAGAFRDGVWSNNALDALLSFWAAGSGSSPVVGGFKHVTSGYDGGGGAGTSVNAMATDQALYGLIAYDRFLKGKNPLYNMSDMINGEYQSMNATSYSIEFDGNGIVSNTVQAASPYSAVTMPSEANVYSWNTKADGTGTKYMPGEQLVMPEHAITLYAQTEQNSQTDHEQNIQKVITLINELPTASAIKREDEGQIKRARAAYEKLTDSEKVKVTNVSQLVTIEGKLNQVLAQYDDELQVTNLIQTIDSLASIADLTADYELAIANARRAYNALTASQRLQITNLNTLTILEAKMAILTEQAQEEHEVGIEASKPTGAAAEQAVIQLITALPTSEHVQLTDVLEVKKARIYYDILPAAEQQKVTNYDKLVDLERRLDELTEQALEKEELEDELNDYSYHKMEIISNVLRIESNKSAGKFFVQVPAEVFATIDLKQVDTVVISDERGVEVTIQLAELMQLLAAKQGWKNLHIEISQYDYESGLFEVKLLITDRKGQTSKIEMAKSYMDVTIPYAYFIDGKHLDEQHIVRIDGNTSSAIAHTSDTKKLTLKLKKDGIFQFVKSEVSFTDIASSATKVEIVELAEHQILKGTGNGLFNPTSDISRAEFAAMVVRALGLEATSSYTPFTDTVGGWYEQDVLALYDAGIINGTSATTFSPNEKLTRQQVGLMMARALRYTGFETASYESAVSYRDIHTIYPTALNDLTALTNLGIIAVEAGYFHPQRPVTREEMAGILNRTLKIAQFM